ncbi:MAG: hypothetical protein IKB25_01915 [Lentisphaeria bacterium]|nr:hypothetical protein [Lentisphaeria bacterium]
MENQKKDLCQLFGLKNYLQEQIIARNRYARTDVEGYAFAAKPVPEYVELMEESSRQMDDLLLQIMDEQDKSLQSGPEKFLKQDVFVWGGPTQLWGGTMDPDCAVRGMEFFGAENAVYVYGSLNEENLDLHKNCKKLIFQITRTARSGEQLETDAECAEKLSLLSLKYPNIIGGIADDLVIYLGRKYSVADVREIRESLKKHNKALDFYGVVYARELDHENIPYIAPCLDAVNLWLDRKSDIAEFDMLIEKCRVKFPGKKIMLGIFMQDINLTDLGYSKELMLRYLEKAERAYRAGKIQSVVILGDREIAKFPELAETIRKFFAERWN